MKSKELTRSFESTRLLDKDGKGGGKKY